MLYLLASSINHEIYARFNLAICTTNTSTIFGFRQDVIVLVCAEMKHMGTAIKLQSKLLKYPKMYVPVLVVKNH